jgi:hypothetical protein
MHILAPTQEDNHVGKPPVKHEGEQGEDDVENRNTQLRHVETSNPCHIPYPRPSLISFLAEMIVDTRSHSS